MIYREISRAFYSKAVSQF